MYQTDACVPPYAMLGERTVQAGGARDATRLRPTGALVLDASTRQALVAVRCLGRAGLRVGTAESADYSTMTMTPPAFHSKWVTGKRSLPSISRDPLSYGIELVKAVEEEPTQVIVPATDASISALRPLREAFERRRVAVAMASEAALEVANDKALTLAVAADLGIAAPRTAPIADIDDVRSALAEVGLPAVLKPVRSWVDAGDFCTRVISRAVTTEDEARDYVESLGRLGSQVIAQQWVGGSRDAVTLFYADGRVWAEFAQTAHRMAPVLGGVSVVRESVPMPADLHAAATALVTALDLEGCSEVEFRRRPDGKPFLMEINARLSGSVEVAVRSGVNFPLLLWQWASGEGLVPAKEYRVGVRMRYLAGDIEWLWENIKIRDRPDSVPPGRALASFAAEFLRPQPYDYLDLHDLAPATAALTRYWADTRRRLGAGLPARLPLLTRTYERMRGR